MEKILKDWRNDIYDVFKSIGISLISHIPDDGHTPLIDLCEKDNNIDVVTLTTEEEGVVCPVVLGLVEKKCFTYAI